MTSYSVVERRLAARVLVYIGKEKYWKLYHRLQQKSRMDERSSYDFDSVESEPIPLCSEDEWEGNVQDMLELIEHWLFFDDRQWELGMQKLLYLKAKFWPPREGRQELRDEQEQQGVTAQQNMKHIQAVFTYIMLWLKLYERLRFFCKFSEFPDRLRPPCTTMPWTIWPALVILWGVCWMFWRPIDGQFPSLQGDEQVVLSSSNTSNSLIEQDLPPSTSFFGNSWEFNAYPLEYHNRQNEPLPLLPTPEFQHGVQLLQASSENCNPILYMNTHQPLGSPQGLHRHVAQIKDLELGFNDLPDISQGNMDEHSIQPAIQFPDCLTYTYEQLNASIVEVGRFKAAAPDIPMPPAVPLASQVEQPAAPVSAICSRSSEPPRNAEGKFMCEKPQCSGLDFATKSQWKTHADKHERPHRCGHQDCESRQGFTSKGDLARHDRTVHKSDHSNATPYFCYEVGCDRGPTGRPFSRKDNLTDHQNRKHRRTLAPLPRESMDGGAHNSAVSNISSRRSQRADVGSTTAPQGKRKQVFDMGATNEGGPEWGNSQKTKRTKRELENNQLKADMERLQREFEELKRFIEQQAQNQKATI